jgi:hypothetical protein
MILVDVRDEHPGHARQCVETASETSRIDQKAVADVLDKQAAMFKLLQPHREILAHTEARHWRRPASSRTRGVF